MLWAHGHTLIHFLSIWIQLWLCDKFQSFTKSSPLYERKSRCWTNMWEERKCKQHLYYMYRCSMCSIGRGTDRDRDRDISYGIHATMWSCSITSHWLTINCINSVGNICTCLKSLFYLFHFFVLYVLILFCYVSTSLYNHMICMHIAIAIGKVKIVIAG